MRVSADDAPIWIGGRAREVWANAYNDADRLLCNVGGKGGPCYRPGPIARRVVAELYPSSRRRQLPGPSQMPNPGGLVYLGNLQGLYVANDDGRIVRKQWGRAGPACLWSKKLHPSGFRRGGAVVCFPRSRIPTPTLSAYSAPALVELYEQWHDGKPPWGISKLRINDDVKLGRAYVCVATLYRSDKFDADGDFRNYIHVHDEGVLARWGPRGVLVRGGRLELTAGGLVK